jgi:hypothetical protein
MELSPVWEFIKQNQFIVGALSGSVAAYLLGLLVSHLRREKRWLGYSVSSRNVVQSGPKKLSLTYDGQTIERLDSHTVVFRNVGNRALKNLPIRISPPTNGRILDWELDAPAGAEFHAKPGNEGLVVTIDLLNPGEAFGIGFSVADANSLEGTQVIARAEFLELRAIGDRAETGELLEALLPHVFLGDLLLNLYKITSKGRK